MKLVKFKYKLPKEIVIPIPVPEVRDVVSVLSIFIFIVYSWLMHQAGVNDGISSIKYNKQVVQSPPATIYVSEVFKSPCAMSYGEEVMLNGCGWEYLGKAHGHSYHVLGRKYGSDCGGKTLNEIGDKDCIKERWLKDGYNNFALLPTISDPYRPDNDDNDGSF
jgi:hypothetical protein